MTSAIRDPDPVVFLEHKAIYRAFRDDVPEDEETMPIGASRTVRDGDDLTMVSWGAMLRRTRKAADRLADEDGVEAEVIDLYSLAPLDLSDVADSVRRTGRAVVVSEAPRTLGVASEVAARIADDAFYHLEAPVTRVTGPDVPVPYFAREQAYLPSVDRITAAARDVLDAQA